MNLSKAPRLLTLLVFLLTSQVANAQQNFQWIGPSNSLFRASNAWNPLGPPGILDRASFDLAGDYNVNFDQNEATDNFDVQNGNATFRSVGLLPSNHVYSLSAQSTIDNGTLTLTENAGRSFQLDVDSLLLVGTGGAATLTVQDNTTVNSGGDGIGTQIGFGASSNGIATVTGSNASWNNTGLFVIGNLGTGTLNVQSGATVGTVNGSTFNGRTTLGESSGATGTLLVDGANSSFSASDFLIVGDEGEGILTITGGGRVSANVLLSSNFPTSSSEIFIGGAGSELIVGSVNLGFGAADLTISNGGALSSSGTVLVGSGDNLVVEGGATLNADSLSNGGRVAVRGGGVVSVTGFTNSSTGIIALDGGTIETGELPPGGLQNQLAWRQGTFRVTGPGGLDLGTNHIGQLLGTPVLTAGKTLDVTNNLTLRSLGNNSSLILDGGTLQAGSLSIFDGSIFGSGPLDIAASVGDNRLVARGVVGVPVTGNANSEIQAQGTLSLGTVLRNDGFRHEGTLNVDFHQVVLNDANEAELGAVTNIALGGRLNAINGATLGPGEVLNVVQDPVDDLGINASNGLRHVQVGGEIESDNLSPAGLAFATGAQAGSPASNANDEDTATRWIEFGTVASGFSGPAIGIDFSTSQSVGSVAWNVLDTPGLTPFASAFGTYTLQYRDDGLTTDDAGWMTLGQADYSNTSEALFRHRFDFDAVEATALRLVTPDSIGQLSELEFYEEAFRGEAADWAIIEGDFTNNGTVNGATGAGQLLVFDDDVDGAGNYTGNVEFRQGFSPGNSPGIVSMENVSFHATSELIIELAGALPGEFDMLEISGDAMLDGGLVLKLLAGFTPLPGDAFTILDIDGTLSGQFIGLDEGDLIGNFAGTELFITYAAGDGNDVALLASAVPEPGTCALLWIALVGLMSRRRQRSLDKAQTVILANLPETISPKNTLSPRWC